MERGFCGGTRTSLPFATFISDLFSRTLCCECVVLLYIVSSLYLVERNTITRLFRGLCGYFLHSDHH